MYVQGVFNSPHCFCQAVKIKTCCLHIKGIFRNTDLRNLFIFTKIQVRSKIDSADHIQTFYIMVFVFQTTKDLLGILSFLTHNYFHQYGELKLSTILSFNNVSNTYSAYLQISPSYLFVIQQFGVFMDSGITSF